MCLLPDLEAAVPDAFSRREKCAGELAGDAGRVAFACRDMASRFHRGGKLLVFGSGSAGSDAAHIAVEFMHPVTVGKRALPAMALAGDGGGVTGIGARAGLAEIYAHQLRHFAAAADIALGLSSDGRCAAVARGLEVARELGLLTVALLGGDGGDLVEPATVDHVLVVRSADPLVVKEVHVTIYHVLWELVHVFLDQPGVIGPEVVV
ncbi:D-sedoheptulose-7-phosphate isomerase [Actinomadura scrupuli]|uniref:D-sedoheptulose-7-phosphate isomerase n=1 Tax=Actinomadura scrupuli TaxID=559629 RepID=UPI003D970FE5